MTPETTWYCCPDDLLLSSSRIATDEKSDRVQSSASEVAEPIFPFFTLPREIRDLVYLACLPVADGGRMVSECLHLPLRPLIV